MSFDDIPEDRKKESFPCECGGDITKNEAGMWECSRCDFLQEDIND